MAPEFVTDLNEDQIRERILNMVQWENRKLYDAKHPDVVSSLNPELKHFELYVITTNYVQIVLKIWLKESLEKAFDDLSNATTIDVNELLGQLDSLHCFQDISNITGSKIFQWCGGQRFQLIVDQQKLFESIHHLVSGYFSQFKNVLINKLFSLCLDSSTQSSFITALTDFLAFVNVHPERIKIFDDAFVRDKVGDDNINGEDLIVSLVQRCQQFSDPSGVLDHFVLLARNLTDNDRSPNFQWLIKEICKRFLLPLVTFENQTIDGRRVVVVQGIAISISKIKDELLVHKKSEFDPQEIQIIGLAAVHIDSDLEHEDWHGMNVVVVTQQLSVDKAVTWNLSGKDGDSSPQEAKSSTGDDTDGFAGRDK